MNGSRDFLDTNVLVYAFDRSDPVRQAMASQVLRNAMDARSGVVCVQVLKEFFQVVTRKIPDPLVLTEARALVRDLATALRVNEDTLDILRRATGLCEVERISIWDAFIVASAAAAGCGRIWTEDLGHDRVLLGVRIVNPFVEAPEGVHERTAGGGGAADDDWPAT